MKEQSSHKPAILRAPKKRAGVWVRSLELQGQILLAPRQGEGGEHER